MHAARISIIPPFQQFVKQNLVGNLHKHFSRNLYILPVVFLGGVWYTNNVDREWRLSHRKKIKKKLLTNKKMYVIIIIERKERGFQKATGQQKKNKKS
jgi:hypothetical protein